MVNALPYVFMGYHYYKFTMDYMLPEIDKGLNRIDVSAWHEGLEDSSIDMVAWTSSSSWSEVEQKKGQAVVPLRLVKTRSKENSTTSA